MCVCRPGRCFAVYNGTQFKIKVGMPVSREMGCAVSIAYVVPVAPFTCSVWLFIKDKAIHGAASVIS